MNDDTKIDVPQPVSIQTGNSGVKRLIPLHEDLNSDAELYALNNHVEPDYINNAINQQSDMPQQTNSVLDECFNPPPLPQQETYENIQVVNDQPKTGVKFDQNSNMESMKHNPYNIIDLFWLINPNFNNGIEEQEAHFCAISFNINFTNLKVTFYKIPNGAIRGNVLFLMSLQRLSSGTIYPSSLFKMKDSYNQVQLLSDKELEETKAIEFTCLEQLVRNTGETWQANRPVCKFEIIKDIIKLIIVDPNVGEYYYNFKDWQLRALIHSAEFALKDGIMLTGQNNINIGRG